MVEVKAVTSDRAADAERLFASSPVTADASACGSSSRFATTTRVEAQRTAVGSSTSSQPRQHPSGCSPVGWCPAGPWSAYTRAARAPTLRASRDKAEDDDVWLVPCFYVHPEAMRRNLIGA
jgi:hypothetical protein